MSDIHILKEYLKDITQQLKESNDLKKVELEIMVFERLHESQIDSFIEIINNNNNNNIIKHKKYLYRIFDPDTKEVYLEKEMAVSRAAMYGESGYIVEMVFEK